MSKSIWTCRKCGEKNDGAACSQCGNPKRHPFDNKFLIFLDCFLILLILFVFLKVVPTFADVFSQFGGSIFPPMALLIKLSNFTKTILGKIVLTSGCVVILVSFVQAIIKKMGFKYWAILFWILLLVLMFLIITLFMPECGPSSLPN